MPRNCMLFTGRGIGALVKNSGQVMIKIMSHPGFPEWLM